MGKKREEAGVWETSVGVVWLRCLQAAFSFYFLFFFTVHEIRSTFSVSRVHRKERMEEKGNSRKMVLSLLCGWGKGRQGK